MDNNPLISLCIDKYRNGNIVLAVTYYPAEAQLQITTRRIYTPPKIVPHDDYKIMLLTCARNEIIDGCYITRDDFIGLAEYGNALDFSIKKDIWLTKPKLWR